MTSPRRPRQPDDLPVIGWREWVALPDLGVSAIKAKIDTGARTSALHVFDLETFQLAGRTWVRFQVHPWQRSTDGTVVAEAELFERRTVRSSTGHTTRRPVILTTVEWMGRRWPLEINLANRDMMGFRMLLGRQALRRRLLVDPSRSFVGGHRGVPAKRRKRKARERDNDSSKGNDER